MTTPVLSPVAKLAFFDSSGAPLSGGKLFTYKAGTTSKQNTYTDSTGATPNTNPIILDSRGECNCWLDPALLYKFTLSPSTDTDPPTNPIWTVDNLGNTTTTAQGITALSSVGGTANAITATAAYSIASYAANQVWLLVPTATNTGATTLNISGLGSRNIFAGGAACVGGELQANVPTLLEDDGTRLNIINSAPFLDGRILAVNATDTSKKLALSLSLLTTGTTRTLTIPDYSIALGKYPTRQIFTTGSGTYTTPAGCIYIRVRMVGGGGGGGAAATNNGTTGHDTTFGTLTAGGGGAGNAGATGLSPGGTATGGDINISGGSGQGGANVAGVMGGQGGASYFGGNGAGGTNAQPGGNGAANSGGGGGGGGNNGTTSGGGGGAGAYLEKTINAPSATYAYAVGGTAAGGAAGGQAGGTGAAGIIIVEEFYA